MLAIHLDNRTSDITGIYLESSVAQMLAAGPKKGKWNYCPVGSQAPFPCLVLGHTKRSIQRLSHFDKSKLNYPTDRIFGGLADSVMWINK